MRGRTASNQWLAQNGDFRVPGGPDVLDWIELIPFDETRNYVERVTEGHRDLPRQGRTGRALSAAAVAALTKPPP